MQTNVHCLDCGEQFPAEGKLVEGEFHAYIGNDCPECGSDDLDPDVENPLVDTVFGQLAVPSMRPGQPS